MSAEITSTTWLSPWVRAIRGEVEPVRWRGRLRALATNCVLLWALLSAMSTGLVLEDAHARVISAVFLVLLAALAGPYREWLRASMGLGIGVIGIVLGARTPGPAGNVIACASVLCGILIAQDQRRAFAPHHLMGALIFLWIELAAQGVDRLWFIWQWLAAGYSNVAGHVLYYTPRWGAQAAGVHLTIAALCLLACQAGVGDARTRARALVVALGLLVLPLAVILVGVRLTGYLGWANGTFPASNPFQLQLLFVPIAALLLSLTDFEARSESTRANGLGRTLQKACLGFAVVLLGYGLVSATSATPRSSAPRPVLFLDHSGPLADFHAPSWNALGYGSAGLYGNLCDLLERSGRSTKQIRTALESADLEGIGTVVVIDPITKFSGHELDLLREHVNRGGGLMVLADHTDLMGMCAPTNQILGAYGIELRFDTAMETNRAFLGNFEFRNVGVFPGAINPIQLQLLHGGSLRVRSPASPVIVGRSMFGDFGDRAKAGNEGFLGDYRFVPAFEQAGDLVVVASCESGRGRVLAWGDTSTFQNVALARSCSAAIDGFRWLDGDDASGRSLSWLALTLGLVALISMLWCGVTLEGAASWTFMGVALTFALSPKHGSVDNSRIVNALLPSKVFFLHDKSLPLWDVDLFKKHSIEGLLMCAARDKLSAVVGDVREVEDLSKCAFIAIVAPGEELDRATQERLDDYIRGGGVVVIAAGFEESRGVAPFLERHGLAIADMPLGAAPVLLLEEMRAYRGLKYVEAWPITGPRRPECETLSAIDGLPVCVECRYGQGRLVVIGDSWFLTDPNLEGERNAEIANLELLLRILGHSPTNPVSRETPTSGQPEAALQEGKSK